MRGEKAFTLVELMIVVTIVAILALIAIPLYSANTISAIMSEGVSGCGTIRTALRIYYSQQGTYVGATLPTGSTQGTLQIGPTDLQGKYFSPSNYTLPALGASTYTVQVTAGASAGRANGNTYSINQLGSELGSYYTNQ
jgi:type IV pilus assembly protein PilE